ncbi:hypothetical protein HD553DRAFT_318488 [Filobasidium floriforme]|uniref:uncharacterized protein n=1 Tax=Filobasidium floriforme TaxID=5210 RepID=UPI001E8EC2BA|nr:uncharacterized protein HD553DRAFT_318488 [Filobasidium floriforme]KAH8079756.1 hypothetical protein HD553DRAFT_318488 [Filobasidium floriforme]
MAESSATSTYDLVELDDAAPAPAPQHLHSQEGSPTLPSSTETQEPTNGLASPLPFGYPKRPGAVGTMADFLAWFPLYGIVQTETVTKVFWHMLTSWFTTGLLYNTTSIDLDEKRKHHPLVQGETAVLRDQKEGKGKGKIRTTALIPFNHNLPDWVVSYFATGYEPGEWVARISMVVEAKRAKDWDIAMSQIIVYMAKALLMDGCAMGLVVAGTEYRFLWWDTKQGRLYWAVPASRWAPDSLEMSEAIEGFTNSGHEWNVAHHVPAARDRARRNLYTIFETLERQVRATIERENQNPLCGGGFQQRPVLDGAKFVEITRVWKDLPGSSSPATIAVTVPDPTLEHPRKLPDGQTNVAQARGNGDEHDDRSEDPAGDGDSYHEDDGSSCDTDEEAQHNAMLESLGDAGEDTKAVCLWFHDFQEEHVFPRRLRHQVETWAQNTSVPSEGQIPTEDFGALSSPTDPGRQPF